MMDNKSVKVLFIFYIFVSVSTQMRAQSKVGTTAVPFLGISVGARGTSMGGAFAAVANDATTMYYNPGGISRIAKSQFVAVHTNWLVNTNFNWVGFVLNLDGTNALGIHFTQLDYGEDEVTTVIQPEGTGERWGAADIAAGISYARNLTDRFSIGGSVKYVQQKIWNESARAFALDVGILFVTQFNDMKLGMSISNFGTDLRMDGKDLLRRVDLDPEIIGHNETIVSKLKTEDWPLPLLFRVGLAMDVLRFGNSYLTISADVLRPSDNTETVNLGGEFSFNDLIFLRVGYKSLFREDTEEGITLGIGITLMSGKLLSWHFDYTYADFGKFDPIRMISIGFTF